MATKKLEQPKKKNFTVACTNERLAKLFIGFFPYSLTAYSAEEAVRTVSSTLARNSTAIDVIFALMPEIEAKFIAQLSVADTQAAVTQLTEEIKASEKEAIAIMSAVNLEKAEELLEKADIFERKLRALYEKTRMAKNDYENIRNIITNINNIGTTLKRLKTTKEPT